tara:strand:+ start:36 stop:251 length:216 start_codon:yes stop_codon:yes gene_type:complete
MTIKIKQLVVKGSLTSDTDNQEQTEFENKSFDETIKELKRYVDQTVDQSFKQVCDSTANQILEKIENKSDF